MAWFSEENRIGLGIVIPYLFHFFSFYVFYYAYKAYFSNLKKEGKTNPSLDQMLTVNLYSFLLSGLYTFSIEFFSRIYIVLYLVNIAYINSIKVYCSKEKRQRITILQFICALSLAMFVYQSSFERIVLTILKNNILF